MDFALKRNELLRNLKGIEARVLQLEADLEQVRAQEQRLIGAVMLCEEVLAASPAPVLEPAPPQMPIEVMAEG